jgi:Flp pilus assembly protein TadG
VEFALVLPLLLIVALALVQVGLLLRDQLVLVEAARAGAREAAVSGADTDVRGAVSRAASTLQADGLGVAVDRGGGQGDPVEVTVTY